MKIETTLEEINAEIKRAVDAHVSLTAANMHHDFMQGMGELIQELIDFIDAGCPKELISTFKPNGKNELYEKIYNLKHPSL